MESTDVINEIRGILPRNSIGKYDLLTIFTHKTVFDKIVKVLSLDFQNKVDYVAAPEAIGWILGTAIAKELGVGFIGVRKGDKLPYAKEEIISTHFTDYSGQDKSFEISKSSIVRNKRVLIVDDWIETGSQMKALIALLEKLDCSIIGLFIDDNMVFDIDNLKGFLNDTSSFGFIAKENNKIIGFAYCYTLLRPDGKTMFYLHSIGMLPNYQDKGYGSKLLSFIKEYSKEIGCSEMFLITDKGNPRACHVYEKLGGKNDYKDEIVYVYDYEKGDK
ncbi:GNAT family N-acetyltransferase [Streptococcus suis]|nr:GNAT family N-acetyltransferase [Streptococcus suis]MBS7893108.1 GNAT family N-acetyltransferase [Streptococcus suis]